MDLRKIKKLIDLLEESNLAEIEIKEGEEVRAPGAHSEGHGASPRRRAIAPRTGRAPRAAMPMQSPAEAATGGTPSRGATCRTATS